MPCRHRLLVDAPCLCGVGSVAILRDLFATMESLSTAKIAEAWMTQSMDNKPLEHKPSRGDDFFQLLRRKTPVRFQCFLRDSGPLRFVVNMLTWATVAPSLVREHPKVVGRFLKLSVSPTCIVNAASDMWNDGRDIGLDHRVQSEKLSCGSHARQCVDLLRPRDEFARGTSSSSSSVPCQKLVLFIHGGAWGSGSQAMCRLVAAPFLERECAVALTSHRTYPDGNMQDQVDDVEDC